MKKKTLALLAAAAALTAAIGVPAWGAMREPASALYGAFAAVFDDGREAPLVKLVSDDDDEGRQFGRSHKDDHHRGSGHDDDDDDAGVRNDTRNLAPGDSVAPPNNGLFSKGSSPKVEVQ